MNARPEQQNAVITETRLTIADHGLLSGWIHMDLEIGSQGFGGHALYLPDSFKHSKDQSNFAGHWIYRVLQIAGVEEWSQLKGKTLRVRGTWNRIEAIGHITKNDWFNPTADFEAMKKHPGA